MKRASHRSATFLQILPPKHFSDMNSMSIGYGALSTADATYFIKRSVDNVTSVVDNAPYPTDLATIYVNSYPKLAGFLASEDIC